MYLYFFQLPLRFFLNHLFWTIWLWCAFTWFSLGLFSFRFVELPSLCQLEKCLAIIFSKFVPSFFPFSISETLISYTVGCLVLPLYQMMLCLFLPPFFFKFLCLMVSFNRPSNLLTSYSTLSNLPLIPFCVFFILDIIFHL